MEQDWDLWGSNLQGMWKDYMEMELNDFLYGPEPNRLIRCCNNTLIILETIAWTLPYKFKSTKAHLCKPPLLFVELHHVVTGELSKGAARLSNFNTNVKDKGLSSHNRDRDCLL